MSFQFLYFETASFKSEPKAGLTNITASQEVNPNFYLYITISSDNFIYTVSNYLRSNTFICQ
jgi:hypothetical protein